MKGAAGNRKRECFLGRQPYPPATQDEVYTLQALGVRTLLTLRPTGPFRQEQYKYCTRTYCHPHLQPLALRLCSRLSLQLLHSVRSYRNVLRLQIARVSSYKLR